MKLLDDQFLAIAEEHSQATLRLLVDCRTFAEAILFELEQPEVAISGALAGGYYILDLEVKHTGDDEEITERRDFFWPKFDVALLQIVPAEEHPTGTAQCYLIAQLDKTAVFAGHSFYGLSIAPMDEYSALRFAKDLTNGWLQSVVEQLKSEALEARRLREDVVQMAGGDWLRFVGSLRDRGYEGRRMLAS